MTAKHLYWVFVLAVVVTVIVLLWGSVNNCTTAGLEWHFVGRSVKCSDVQGRIYSPWNTGHPLYVE